MSPIDVTDVDGDATTRRRVLESVGAAGVGATGIGGATGRTSAACEPRWRTETCVRTVEETAVLDGCRSDGAAVPPDTEAVILDYTCCDETDEYYYVEWCEADYPQGLVAETALERIPSCCGSCSFRWEPETCVTTTGTEVPIYEDDCAEEPTTVTTGGAEGIIQDRACCEQEGGPVPRYLIEWCNAELPTGWVTQSALTASADCCGPCEPQWAPETCVETAVDDVPIFDEECSGDPFERLPQGVQATVLEGGCCEGEIGPTPGYYVEWCDPELPVAWIREADLVESSECCNPCEFQWDVDDCVRVRFDGIPLFDAACATEAGTIEARAVVADRRCCDVDGERKPRYALEWCDSSFPAGWVDETAIVESAPCCDCDLQFEPGLCVTTYEYEAALYEEPCAGEYELIPEQATGVIQEGACCEFNGDPWKGYYVEWCDPDVPDGWVGDFTLSAADGCCEEP